MINNEDPSQQTIVRPAPAVAVKPKKSKNLWIIVACALAVAILACLAYFAGASSKPQATVPPANSTPSASKPPTTPATPPVVTPPAATPAPVYTPPPPPPPAPAPAPVPAPQPAPAQQPIVIVAPDSIITRQAYTMVLTISDMGTGWIAGNAASAPQQQALSTSHVSYTGGSAFTPVVQNTVTVFRSINAAQNAFDALKPNADVALTYPAIGDSCFVNTAQPINQMLVFRKNNVVASIQIQQDRNADLEHYARIIEPRISP
jgi:hypothetical protein